VISPAAGNNPMMIAATNAVGHWARRKIMSAIPVSLDRAVSREMMR
jgi:hypothetical protein